ncbi:MAG: ABC transporter permease [Actinomycetaceae bacterium]|nr:ABC transporter permease [Actinomycetaceae bacterium]
MPKERDEKTVDNRLIARYSTQQHYVSDVDETGLGAVDAVKDESAPSSLWGEAWKKMRKRPLFWVSALIILTALLMAIVPWIFTSQDPRYCDIKFSLEGAQGGHVLGFDKQGCDLYARMVYGARASVTVGVISTLIATVIGVFLGAVAGYVGGWIDAIISRIVDIFFAIPLLLAAIVIMQMFRDSRSTWSVALVLGIFGWTQIARITRGSVMSTKHDEFVIAAKALGMPSPQILMKHILPNAMAPIIVYATVALGTFIVAEASLSFLGIGLPDTSVSWGGDISQAQHSLRDNPMVLFYPSLALAFTVLGFIMMGDVVRDALGRKAKDV